MHKLFLRILSLVLLASCEQTDSSFPDYQSTVSHQSKGWLPSFLPAGATRIRETHDLDTGQTWVRFTLSAAELALLKQSLVRVDLPSGCTRLNKRNWWPEELAKCDFNRARTRLNLEYYRTPNDPAGWAAIDAAAMDIYFWRTGT